MLKGAELPLEDCSMCQLQTACRDVITQAMRSANQERIRLTSKSHGIDPGALILLVHRKVLLWSAHRNPHWC